MDTEPCYISIDKKYFDANRYMDAEPCYISIHTNILLLLESYKILVDHFDIETRLLFKYLYIRLLLLSLLRIIFQLASDRN